VEIGARTVNITCVHKKESNESTHVQGSLSWANKK
jgi:hypothetical protein